MTDPADDGVWRDEEKLPVSELSKAMATWDTDGQGDPVNEPEPDADLPPSTIPRSGEN